MKTPRNNTSLLLLLFSGAGLFAFSTVFFLFSVLWKRSNPLDKIQSRYAKFLLIGVSSMMLYYMTALYSDEGIFFASAPFKNFEFSLHDITAYIPFVLLVSMIPLLKMYVQVFRGSTWGFISKSLFTLNMLFYIAFIFLFFYWGLYHIS